MSKEGRGLICVALTEDRCAALQLAPMVTSNTSLHETAFTVSVDLIGEGTTTGISAQDRSKTILALVNPNTRPDQLGRPGHIFPLKAVAGGVLRRTGHTEATIDLARLAGLQPAGALVEVMNEDGSMARLPQLLEIGARFGIKVISIKDLIDFRLRTDSLIEELVRVDMPTAFGHFTLVAFKEKLSGAEHLALVKGSWQPNEPVLTRVHSSCFTGDILSSLRCDCGEQLHNAMRKIEQEGKGVIVYMNQEGRGIGLINKLKAYQLQENGLDTVEANLQLGFGMDDRDYGVGAQILRYLGITQLRLLEVTEVIPIETSPNSYNLKYLETKRDKLGHDILNKE
jgi:3,4-dihydroxy 2-butanone 4-phosphate synthase/GTP cyclohydrolase II